MDVRILESFDRNQQPALCLRSHSHLLGNGPHTIRALADGVVFAEAAVQVTTLSSEFLEGVSGQYELANFPQAGRTVAVQWQESLQNFVITAVEETDGGLPPPPPPPPPM